MAIFGKKKEENKKEETKVVSTPTSSDTDLSWVLKKPRITEKSTISASDNSTYVFTVDQRANKSLVKKAISEIYKVTPVKVNITPIPRKRVFARGKKGVKGGGKKAYVFLKKGDNIQFV